VHTPQENGIKDIDEAYLTLWERLRLDMIRSKSEGAAFLPVCSSETLKALSRTLFSFGRPRVCALRVVPDRPTERRQGLPHGEPLPERVFPGRHHHRRAGAYLHFPLRQALSPNNNAGAVRLNQISLCCATTTTAERFVSVRQLDEGLRQDDRLSASPAGFCRTPGRDALCVLRRYAQLCQLARSRCPDTVRLAISDHVLIAHLHSP